MRVSISTRNIPSPAALQQSAASAVKDSQGGSDGIPDAANQRCTLIDGKFFDDANYFSKRFLPQPGHTLTIDGSKLSPSARDAIGLLLFQCGSAFDRVDLVDEKPGDFLGKPICKDLQGIGFSGCRWTREDVEALKITIRPEE